MTDTTAGEGVLRAALGQIVDLCPATCETGLAHEMADIAREALAAQPSAGAQSFQSRVLPWLMECFGADIAADLVERCDRFIEEALEQVQSLGWDRARAHALVEYVYGRPAGEPHQEAGGVMVTFAALCQAAGLDMQKAGDDELARIMRSEIVQKIRAKQAAKPTGSALPISTPAQPDTALSSKPVAVSEGADGIDNPDTGGWIVGNANDTKWRTWDDFGCSTWTDDRDKATRYHRREDAELVHREDEDAWRVAPYGKPDTGDVAALREKQMVERFLRWKLPADFDPDDGISFKPMFNEHTDHPMRHEPTGTNLLNYDQALTMVRYIVGEGEP